MTSTCKCDYKRFHWNLRVAIFRCQTEKMEQSYINVPVGHIDGCTRVSLQFAGTKVSIPFIFIVCQSDKSYVVHFPGAMENGYFQRCHCTWIVHFSQFLHFCVCCCLPRLEFCSSGPVLSSSFPHPCTLEGNYLTLCNWINLRKTNHSAVERAVQTWNSFPGKRSTRPHAVIEHLHSTILRRFLLSMWAQPLDVDLILYLCTSLYR